VSVITTLKIGPYMLHTDQVYLHRTFTASPLSVAATLYVYVSLQPVRPTSTFHSNDVTGDVTLIFTFQHYLQILSFAFLCNHTGFSRLILRHKTPKYYTFQSPQHNFLFLIKSLPQFAAVGTNLVLRFSKVASTLIAKK